MNRLLTLALPALLVGATATPAPAADVTEAELMQAATALAQQYDANYAAKNPAAMAQRSQDLDQSGDDPKPLADSDLVEYLPLPEVSHPRE
jgi:hypothetical protein